MKNKTTPTKEGGNSKALSPAKITLEIFEGLHDEKPASVELTRKQWKALERSHVLDKLNNQKDIFVQITLNMKGECSGKLSLEEKFYLWWNSFRYDLAPSKRETHAEHVARVAKVAFMKGGANV